jgi:hypothetical protein
MTLALGFANNTSALVDTFTHGFGVALIISRSRSFVIAGGTGIDCVLAFACFEIARARLVTLPLRTRKNLLTKVNAFALPLSITLVVHCLVVLVVARRTRLFLWVRTFASLFIAHALEKATALDYTADVFALVFSFAYTFSVTLVFNCFSDPVITLSASFLGRVRTLASTLFALSQVVALTFDFARRFALAKINFRCSTTLAFDTLIVHCVLVSVIAFCTVFLVGLHAAAGCFITCGCKFATRCLGT